MPARMCSTLARPNRQPTHKCVHPHVHLPVPMCPMSARVLTTMYHLNRAKSVQATSSCSPNNSWAWPCKVSPFCPYICCEGSSGWTAWAPAAWTPKGQVWTQTLQVAQNLELISANLALPLYPSPHGCERLGVCVCGCAPVVRHVTRGVTGRPAR